ncbi:hypothetical protein WR25_09558 [Diploscapter pachys]|uniref:histone deacetylase n=1 Tax=Diploscapter pachys TaxID=2018661 RepID=A0A2A2KXH4_9BILA|nr:hypothetical protein WR25_09558 [Diploscapter pachys]
MDLVASFTEAQRALSQQHLLQFYQALQQQQATMAANSESQNGIERMDESGPEFPVAPLTLTSSLSNILSGTSSQPQTPTTSRDSASNSIHRAKQEVNRTASAITISQHTKDRLKTMLQNKVLSKENSQLSLVGTPPASSVSGSSAVSSALSHTPMSPHVNVSSPHFEPYRIPSTLSTAQSVGNEYQLRKVNSEPNLKMKIRAKLLNKTNSPVQHNNAREPVSAFNFAHPQLKRSDSETSNSVPLDSLLAAQSFNPHLMMPSPSLPNLSTPLQPLAQFPLDMSALMAASNLTSFLSLPSLLKAQLGLGGLTEDDNGIDRLRMAAAASQAGTSGLLSQSVAVGGYPSLLKQQLKELVLRRKSLVREEPEDSEEAANMNSMLHSRLQALAAASSSVAEATQTGLAYDTAMSRHECVCGDSASHVEHGGRVQSIWSRLHETGLVSKCERITAKKASLDQLKLVHSPTYTTFFAVSPTACLKMEPSQLPVKSFVQLPCGGIGIDSDTYFNDATTQSAARIATGSLIELASQVVENRLRNGFACIRPPGHHAEKDQAMGFCFFNNIAITAKYLQQKYPQQCQRIAIIDWDVHHGNGTQPCFEEDPNVLYLSIHRHDNGNFFPGTGSVVEIGKGPGKGFTVNVPFSGGVMRDADYLAAWRVIVQPVLDHYQPTFILVSAGFDAAQGHPNALGGYEISAEMFGYMTKQLMNYANGKVVLALEGGYDLASISDAAEQCVRVLCGDDENAGKLSAAAMATPPCLSAQETIQKVIAIHKGYWPTLTTQHGIITSSELQWQSIGRALQNLSMSPNSSS